MKTSPQPFSTYTIPGCNEVQVRDANNDVIGVAVAAGSGYGGAPANFDTVTANAAIFAAGPRLYNILWNLIDQLDGIGIPEWRGAEGLCLNSAREALKEYGP